MQRKTSHYKVAIVHDVLDRYGGAERVVESLLKIWPKAGLYVSRFSDHAETRHFVKFNLATTFMQYLPFWSILAKFYTPLYPLAFENLDLSNYDVVVSSTAHFAKGVLTTPNQLHVCYCHTPPRFLYYYPSETQTRAKWPFKPFVAVLDHVLRLYDYWATQRPDVIIANSLVVADRIKKFYRREATVIHPPACPAPNDIGAKVVSMKQTPGTKYYLVVSRLVAYKNINTVVRSFNNRSEQLVIVGTGPELESLRLLAGENIEFWGFVPEDELSSLYQNARALIFSASDEDFGIIPVEAMAHGTPVIALKSGGVQETVVGGKTGVFYDQDTTQALNQALDEFTKVEGNLNRQEIVDHAKKFSVGEFESVFKSHVESLLCSKGVDGIKSGSA